MTVAISVRLSRWLLFVGSRCELMIGFWLCLDNALLMARYVALLVFSCSTSGKVSCKDVCWLPHTLCSR